MSTLASELSFRLARREDLPAIVAIYNSTVASKQVTADVSPVSVDERLTWFDAHQQAHRPLCVLCDDAGEVAAWAALSDYYPRAAYRISAEISLYVHEAWRGRGVGRRMLSLMQQQAQQLGIRNLLALIFAHNAASIGLFSDAGFSLWGTLPQVCDLEDFEADVVILGKRLPEASFQAALK
ncbi:MAG: GNAT family N-acetyltransferase [Neisseria sp.]|nr:GNAT family N-acetyltransferase [Neisseria sp.]